MKHILLNFLFLNLCLVLVCNVKAANAVSALNKSDLKLHVQEILKEKKISPEQLSLIISYKDQDLEDINSRTMLIPASISKLFTSYAVLKTINLNQKFKTELFLDNKNLYLKGGGDPSFVSENLWYLVNEFTRQNVKIISGDLIVDDSLFDQVRFDDSRESKRVDRSYDSPVGAMSFNWNSINIFVNPADKVNQPAQVVLDPENKYFSLVNRTTTKSKIGRDLIIDVNQKSRTITVSGDVLKSAQEKAYFKNVAEPELWAAENLRAFLLQRGIVITGKIKKGVVPVQAEKVASYEGKSLSATMADMNKFSNNFVAEMLTKNIAALSGEKPATLKTGVQIINQHAKLLGLTAKDFYIENPSGFTRDNRFSAYAMNEVLKAIQNDFRLFPTLLDSLPIAGIDGTLKKRMKGTDTEGFVRAKTGYLDGVVSLAGYAGLRNGDILHFAFLYNGPQDENKVRQAFDQILVYILE